MPKGGCQLVAMLRAGARADERVARFFERVDTDTDTLLQAIHVNRHAAFAGPEVKAERGVELWNAQVEMRGGECARIRKLDDPRRRRGAQVGPAGVPPLVSRTERAIGDAPAPDVARGSSVK